MTSRGACTVAHLPTICTRSQTCSTVRSCTGIFATYSVQAAGFLPIPTGKAQQRPALGGSAMGDAAPGGIDITGTDTGPSVTDAVTPLWPVRTDAVACAHGRCAHGRCAHSEHVNVGHALATNVRYVYVCVTHAMVTLCKSSARAPCQTQQRELT